MDIEENVSLASYNTFLVGGLAEQFVVVKNSDELFALLASNTKQPVWVICYGSNCLISDKGLPGLVICTRGGSMNFQDNEVVVDAGVWWDDVVKACVDRKLWGVELMSEIPGGVGGATYINITAYGQSIGPLIKWVEVWNPKTKQKERILRENLVWSYKTSIFQKPEYMDFVILQVCLSLSTEMTNQLQYQKALDVAEELNLNPEDLDDRRKIITEARKRSGSIWRANDQDSARTAGSFFRNPIVNEEQVNKIIATDESGKTTNQIRLMNKVHGGDSRRVSAAHVMLASGFNRGQTWGKVKLNDKNLLKVEALEGATAKEIYDVSRMIQTKCLDMLGINLEFEVRILGDFS